MADTLTCGRCGLSVPSRANFCPKCGTPLPKGDVPLQPVQFTGHARPLRPGMVACGSCGVQLAASIAFCPDCGAVLRVAAAPSSAPQAQAARREGQRLAQAPRSKTCPDCGLSLASSGRLLRCASCEREFRPPSPVWPFFLAAAAVVVMLILRLSGTTQKPPPSPPAPQAPSVDLHRWVTKPGYAGAFTEEALERLVRIASDRDERALDFLIRNDPNVFMLPAGVEVARVDSSGFLGAKVKLRRKGTLAEFWTVREAIEHPRLDSASTR